MSISQNVDLLFARLTANLQQDLTGFAAYAEEMAKTESEGHWDSDSGSARASITGYSVNAENYDKNFQAAAWAAAQTPGYASPRWHNPAENFYPYDGEDKDAGEVAVILAMFIGYGESLELGEPAEAEHRLYPGGQHQPIIPGTLSDTTQQVADDFHKAVAQSIANTLLL